MSWGIRSTYVGVTAELSSGFSLRECAERLSGAGLFPVGCH